MGKLNERGIYVMAVGERGAFGIMNQKKVKHTQHLRHRTLMKTHAKSELHILDQMELDELIGFADRHSVDIQEEVKIDKETVLTKILNDPGVIKMKEEMKLC